MNNHKSMADLSPVDQARKALAHILDRVAHNSSVGFYLGYGTESFSLATEALATLDGTEPKSVREAYKPQKQHDPYEEGVEAGEDGARSRAKPEITQYEEANLLAAVTELETSANSDHLAAATNTEHRTYALLQNGARKDQIAAGLYNLALRLGEKGHP